MPCITIPTAEEERAARNADRNNGREEGRKEMEPLLCSACRALENADYDFDLNPLLAKWWHDHKEEDRRRNETETREQQMREFRENCIKEALKKPFNQLTVSEKRLLKQEGFFK